MNAQAATQGSSPIPPPAMTPAAAAGVVHDNLDLLGQLEHTSAVPIAKPEAAVTAASSEASRAQSQDSAALLGTGEAAKSLSLSGWNNSGPKMRGMDLSGSSAYQEPSPALVRPHRSCLCHCKSQGWRSICAMTGCSSLHTAMHTPFDQGSDTFDQVCN